MLPTDLLNIIHKKKTSMCVYQVNQQILTINRKQFKADDIYCHEEQHFWDDNHKVYVLIYKNLKIKPINLDYLTYRNLGFQWTYICQKCGEFLKLSNKKSCTYSCKCCNYV